MRRTSHSALFSVRFNVCVVHNTGCRVYYYSFVVVVQFEPFFTRGVLQSKQLSGKEGGGAASLLLIK